MYIKYVTDMFKVYTLCFSKTKWNTEKILYNSSDNTRLPTARYFGGQISHRRKNIAAFVRIELQLKPPLTDPPLHQVSRTNIQKAINIKYKPPMSNFCVRHHEHNIQPTETLG